jgi:hypothetical protein
MQVGINLGGTPMPMAPAAFGKLIADETEKRAKVIKFANIKPRGSSRSPAGGLA